MLTKLFVRNYAIIAGVEVSFTDRLNIITGETGAGKSLLVGALGLVLGDRADTSVLRDPAQKAIVEATFTGCVAPAIAGMFERWDLDPSEEVVVRREVSAAGKSRAFLNDTPVNLSQLQELASALVDMHLQFDTLDLGRQDFQRRVLDALCGHEALLQRFRECYAAYADLRRAYDAHRRSVEEAARELDYNRYLFEELSEADWQAREMEDLEAELLVLSHAEQIKGVLGQAAYALDGSEQPVVQQLKGMVNRLQAIGDKHPHIPALTERLQSAFLELQDLSAELERINDRVQMDAGRMEEVNRRIAVGQRLMKKHGVRTSEELLQVQAELAGKVARVTDAEAALAELSAKTDAARAEAVAIAETLGANRRAQAGPLAERTAALLKRVGMPNAVLKVDIQPAELGESGMDKVTFLFDANRTGRYEPLHKVASGGELSRLMLSVKSLVAGSLSMPTLIFDEIDSGISGEAALQVGILMRELAENHQVVSITHQPQIAARAHSHFHIYKSEQKGVVNTQVRRLSEEERVEAVARMLGGEKPSAVVLQSAREMVAGA